MVGLWVIIVAQDHYIWLWYLWDRAIIVTSTASSLSDLCRISTQTIWDRLREPGFHNHDMLPFWSAKSMTTMSVVSSTLGTLKEKYVIQSQVLLAFCIIFPYRNLYIQVRVGRQIVLQTSMLTLDVDFIIQYFKLLIYCSKKNYKYENSSMRQWKHNRNSTKPWRSIFCKTHLNLNRRLSSRNWRRNKWENWLCLGNSTNRASRRCYNNRM